MCILPVRTQRAIYSKQVLSMCPAPARLTSKHVCGESLRVKLLIISRFYPCDLHRLVSSPLAQLTSSASMNESLTEPRGTDIEEYQQPKVLTSRSVNTHAWELPWRSIGGQGC